MAQGPIYLYDSRLIIISQAVNPLAVKKSALREPDVHVEPWPSDAQEERVHAGTGENRFACPIRW